MRLTKVLIYLVILGLLGGYVYLVEIKQKQRKLDEEDKAQKIVKVDKARITEIDLLSRDGRRVTLQKPSETWVVTEPVKTKADDSAVQSIIAALANAKPERTLSEKDVTWDEYGLGKPDFTVTVTAGEQKTKIAFGAPNPTKTSWYMQVNGDPRLFLAADTLKNALNKTAFDLRDKAVFRIAESDVERIIVTNDRSELELQRRSPSKWVLTKPESFSAKSAVATRNVRSLTNLNAKDIIDAPNKEGDPYGLANPGQTITLAGEKLSQTLLVGGAVKKDGAPETDSDRYAKLKDHDEVYVISGRSLKELKTDPQELRDRSLVDFNPTDTEKLEIDLEGKQWIATVDKDKKWALTKPEKKEKLDSWDVTRILWDIRDQEWKSITKPAPDGLSAFHLDPPQLTIQVFTKGNSEPAVLKMGWESVAPAPKPDETGPAEAQRGEKPSEDKPKEAATPEGTAGDQPAIPDTIFATAKPHEEGDAVFTVEGKFLSRLKESLKNLTESK